ncbi:Protein PRD1 [Bienertia sinuspersici]
MDNNVTEEKGEENGWVVITTNGNGPVNLTPKKVGKGEAPEHKNERLAMYMPQEVVDIVTHLSDSGGFSVSGDFVARISAVLSSGELAWSRRQVYSKSLSTKWRLRPQDKLLSLGRGTYVLKNLSQDSFNLIQSQRPWIIGGFFIGIRAWEPGLKNSDKLFSRIPLWIELPELPVEFHAKEALEAIGNHLGSFIK